LIARGLNATTNLTGTETKATVTGGRLLEYRKFIPSNPSATVLYFLEGGFSLSLSVTSNNPSSIDDTKANNAALRKFVSKLDSVNTAFQGGVFLGELAETLHGIKHPAQGLRKLIDRYYYSAIKLRSSRLRGVRFLNQKKRSLREFGNNLSEMWLEHAFHWKPLMNDIDAGARALAEIGTRQCIVSRHISAVGEASANGEDTAAQHVNGGLRWIDHAVTFDHSIVVYRGAVRVNARDNALMAPRLLGFNPASFVPTAWELLPYSFLIDYFTNVGDILSGWSHSISECSWANRTSIKEYIVRRSVTSKAGLWSGDANHKSFSLSPAKVEIAKRTVSRSSYLGSLTPRFEFEIPGLGSKKWLNIAALVVGRSNDRSFKYGD